MTRKDSFTRTRLDSDDHPLLQSSVTGGKRSANDAYIYAYTHGALLSTVADSCKSIIPPTSQYPPKVPCKVEEGAKNLPIPMGCASNAGTRRAPRPVPRTGHADLCELDAQEVDRAAVERLERVPARNGALFHERFLGCEERRVELALGWGERAVYGEGTCCVNGWMIDVSEPGTVLKD
jgi:hypothetical protein